MSHELDRSLHTHEQVREDARDLEEVGVHGQAALALDAMLAESELPTGTLEEPCTEEPYTERAAARQQRAAAARAMPIWQEAFDLPRLSRTKARRASRRQ
jgi:hypothetical protein